ncbi:MAG: P-loop NTPase fold protein [Stygiolobus sp.]|nr:P-loop NTPase fold protein [Stygiolobus sp.]
MLCKKLISQTGQGEEVLNAYKCMLESKFKDRIRYYLVEKVLLNYIKERKVTPLLIVVKGDWGNGKTTLMNIIKEEVKDYKITVKKIDEIIKDGGHIDVDNKEILVIDEVENLEGLEGEEQSVKEFFTSLKKVSEKEGFDSVIMMLTTPGGYDKVFMPQGLVKKYLGESYIAIIDRIKNYTVELQDASKIEYFAMLYCLSKQVMERPELVDYLNFLYYTIPVSRRNITNIVNVVLCNLDSPDPMEILDLLKVGKIEEGFTITSHKFIKSDVREDRAELLMKGYSKNVEGTIKAKLVKYSYWREFVNGKDVEKLEDYIVVFKYSGSFDNSLYVVLPEDVREFNPFITEEELIKEAYEKLEGEIVFVPRWKEFESVFDVQLKDFVISIDASGGFLEEYNKYVSMLTSPSQYKQVYPLVLKGLQELIKIAIKRNNDDEITCIERKPVLDYLVEFVCDNRQGPNFSFVYRVKIVDVDRSDKNVGDTDFTVYIGSPNSEAPQPFIPLTFPIQKYLIQLSYLPKYQLNEATFNIIFDRELKDLQRVWEDIKAKRSKVLDLYYTKDQLRTAVLNYLLYYPPYARKWEEVSIEELFKTLSELRDEVKSFSRERKISEGFVLEDITTAEELRKELSVLNTYKIISLSEDFINFKKTLSSTGEYWIKFLVNELRKRGKLIEVYNDLITRGGKSGGIISQIIKNVIEKEEGFVSDGLNALLYFSFRSGEVLDYLDEKEKRELSNRLSRIIDDLKGTISQLKEKVKGLDKDILTIKQREAKIINAEFLVDLLEKYLPNSSDLREVVITVSFLKDLEESVRGLIQSVEAKKITILSVISEKLKELDSISSKLRPYAVDQSVIIRVSDYLRSTLTNFEESQLRKSAVSCIQRLGKEQGFVGGLFKALNRRDFVYPLSEFIYLAYKESEVIAVLSRSEECIPFAEEVKELGKILDLVEKLNFEISNRSIDQQYKILQEKVRQIKESLNSLKKVVE